MNKGKLDWLTGSSPSTWRPPATPWAVPYTGSSPSARAPSPRAWTACGARRTCSPAGETRHGAPWTLGMGGDVPEEMHQSNTAIITTAIATTMKLIKRSPLPESSNGSCCFRLPQIRAKLISPAYTCDVQCDFWCDFAYKTRLTLPRTDAFCQPSRGLGRKLSRFSEGHSSIQVMLTLWGFVAVSPARRQTRAG